MKAAVYHGTNDIRIEEHATPEKRSDNIIIKVICCLICGTDLKIWQVGNPKVIPPRILGHELIGEIVHIGWEESGFCIGDRVTLATTIPCGECAYCQMGLGNICPSAKGIGTALDGAFAEYFEIPERTVKAGHLVKVPDSVPDEAGALSEPLSCALNAHQIVNVMPGDTVLIIGGGPLGAIHAELAKAEGAKQVILVEISKERLLLLEHLKDVILIDGSSCDVQEIVKKHTHDLGADKAFICAPSAPAFESVFTLVRKGGAISFFASLPVGRSNITIDSRLIHYNELRVAGVSDSRPEHVVGAMGILKEERFNSSAIVTHRLGLEDILNGFKLMKEGKSLKVAIYPDEMRLKRAEKIGQINGGTINA